MTQQEMTYSQLSGESYRALRKHSFSVGVCLLISFLAQEIIILVLYLFGFGDLLENNLSFQYSVYSLLLTVGAMMMPFFLYSLRKGRMSYIKALPFHSDVSSDKMRLIIAMGFGLCVAANSVASLASVFFSAFGLEGEMPEVPASQNGLDIFMNFVASAVAAPLVEEFIFRGVFMQPLRRYGDRFAIVVTAAVFGVAHGRPANIVFAFLSGIIIGCAVVYSRSIWVGIIIHALNNAFSTIFIELDSAAVGFADTLYLIACVAISVIGIVAFIIYGKKYGLRMKRDTSGLSVRRKFTGFFLSVPMVLSVIYYLVNIVKSLG